MLKYSVVSSLFPSRLSSKLKVGSDEELAFTFQARIGNIMSTVDLTGL